MQHYIMRMRSLRKDIRIGDTVTVERAGDVIPHVISVDLKERNKESKKFIFPDKLSILWFPKL